MVQLTSVATPWSWDVSSLLPPGGTFYLLKRLPKRPMASALLEELKPIATEVKRSQIKDTVGASWVALAVEEDPQRREIGTLLVEAGVGGGGGGRGC